MKIRPSSLLILITVFAIAFTAGLFIGRNYSGAPISVSVPEEILLPPPSAAHAIDDSADIDTDVVFPIDINQASMTELTALPGIGAGIAEDIIAYREANGPFSHVEQLMRVPGIGENRLESILSLITIGGTQ